MIASIIALIVAPFVILTVTFIVSVPISMALRWLSRIGLPLVSPFVSGAAGTVGGCFAVAKLASLGGYSGAWWVFAPAWILTIWADIHRIRRAENRGLNSPVALQIHQLEGAPLTKDERQIVSSERAWAFGNSFGYALFVFVILPRLFGVETSG